ncbi:MAG: EAL domain-containing protein [Alphaproteobacteria bacterium]
MPLIHFVIALSYAGLSVLLAFILPSVVPGLSALGGVVVAALVLTASVIGHGLVAGFVITRTLAGQVRGLGDGQAAIRQELAEARGEAGRIHKALEGAGHGATARQRLDEMTAEVRVLQSLVDQLSEHQAANDHGRRRGFGIGAEALAATGTDGQAPAAAVTSRLSMPLVAQNLDDAAILDAVREGLRTNQVDLFLQPIVSLPQRKRRAYECYSRIRISDSEMVVPEQYLALAEREGLVTAIDNMLLFRCVQLVRKAKQENYDYQFFCNISSSTLADTQFLRDFIAFMGQNAELAASLVFEFSQKDLGSATAEMVAALRQLAGWGFRFSMDHVDGLDLDFRLLRDNNVRFVKLPAEHVLSAMAEDGPGQGFRLFKRALDGFGVDLIVDHIEEESDLVELLDLNIDYGQGFLFGEPRLSRNG